MRREDLNPEIIDMLLGKPDSELMKEDVQAAMDTSKSEDERLAALDHLEMLVEQIDNANNLGPLKLWEPLQSLLTSENSSKEIKIQTMWVLGTAVQNNPQAQDLYLTLDPLPTLLSFLSPSPSSDISTRSKAVYALSALLKHNAPAVSALSKLRGWEKFRDALQDPNIGVRRKVIFLLAALLVPTGPIPQPIQSQPQALLPPPPQPTSAQPTSQTESESQPQLQLRFIPADPANPTAASASTIALHARDSEDPAPSDTPSSQQILTPDSRPAGSSDPVHNNSHAANLRDASRAQTSALTMEALSKHKILDAIITSVVTPLPHGEDGENTEADHDYDEKAMSLLNTYAVQCHGSFTPAQKTSLKEWLEGQKVAAGGASELEEKLNLTNAELAEFTSKL